MKISRYKMEILRNKLFRSQREHISIMIFLLVSIYFVLGVSLVRASALPKPPNNLGLVGYWSMEDGHGTTTTDFSGNGNTGTLTNFALATSTGNWVAGKTGTALAFDGSNDYVDLGTKSNLTLAGPLTISAWIKPAVVTVGTMEILCSCNGQQLSNYALEINRTAGKLSMLWDNTVVSTGGTVLSANKWYHVVGVRRGSSGAWVANLYVNGVQDATSTTATNPDNTTLQTTIGRLGQILAAEFYFNGSIDDVRLYNRALSAAEITTLYNQSEGIVKLNKQPATVTNGLVGYWRLDEGTGASTADRSGKGNTGTWNGTGSTHWVTGKYGTAGNFNGTDDYVDAGNGTSVNLSDTFTVSAWIKETATSSNAVPIGKVLGGSAGWMFYQEGPPDKPLLFFVYNYAVNSVSLGQLLPLNTWVHLVGVSTSTQTCIYMNGKLKNCNNKGAGSYVESANNLRFGRYGNNGQYFNGSIDDVRLYNRALSADEIKQLYNGGAVKLNSSQNSKLTNGLVGLWSFNGPDLTTTTATDGSGQGTNGTLLGTNGKPIPTLGKIGQALKFDGLDDYVNLTPTSTLEQAITGNTFTVSVWVNPSSLSFPSIGLGGIFTSDQTSPYRFYLRWDNSQGFAFSPGVNYKPTLATSTWYFVTGTFDSAVGETLYLNGSPVASGNTKTLVLSNGDAFYIGVDYLSSSGRNWPGKIDDLRVYNRALSASEVLQLYNQGK